MMEKMSGFLGKIEYFLFWFFCIVPRLKFNINNFLANYQSCMIILKSNFEIMAKWAGEN